MSLTVSRSGTEPLRHACGVPPPLSRGGTGVPVRPTRDEQSLILSETVVPCYRDSQQLDKGYCPEAAALCSRALFFCVILSFQRSVQSCPACQGLSLWGQRRRPPPAAETVRSCWGSGQQDASDSVADAGSRNSALARQRLRGLLCQPCGVLTVAFVSSAR